MHILIQKYIFLPILVLTRKKVMNEFYAAIKHMSTLHLS